MTDLSNTILSYDNGIEKSKNQYSGLLGLTIGGHRVVNIPTRHGYVYVRLRDNLSEVVNVYNDKVSPAYDFPVIIERKGNRWVVVGKDINRYENWGTPYPFLPAHADTHSFNRDGSGGGDAVAIYPDQFMPLLVYPSGTYGAGNLQIAPYVLQRANDFIYVGNTGTTNLLVYKPTNNQAVMGLVYIDTTSGVPGILINSGTPFAGSVTGTASVIQYLPNPSTTQEPLYGFRLVSGTSTMTWDSLYNVRQFYGGGSASTGTSGVSDHEALTGLLGGSANNHWHLTPSQLSGLVSGTNTTLHSHSGTSLSSFITGSIPYSGADGILTENNLYLRFESSYNGFRMGKNFPQYNNVDQVPIGITAFNANQSSNIAIRTYGTGTSGAPTPLYQGYRSRGTVEVPTPVQAGDALYGLQGNGWDGSAWKTAGRIRAIADGNFLSGTGTPGRLDFDVIPSGTTAIQTIAQLRGDGFNLTSTGTYNINGTPHIHAGGGLAGSDTQVQFNDGGAFGADADFTWNKTTNVLTFGNNPVIGGYAFAFPALAGTVATLNTANVFIVAQTVGSGTSGENPALVFALPAFPTSYTHRITTQHSATVGDNRLNIQLCDGGASSWNNILALKGNGYVGMGLATDPLFPLHIKIAGNAGMVFETTGASDITYISVRNAASSGNWNFEVGRDAPYNNLSFFNIDNDVVFSMTPEGLTSIGRELFGRYSSVYPTSGGGYYRIRTNNTDPTSGGISIDWNNAGTLTEGFSMSAGISLFSTDLKLGTVGNGLYVKEGTNATSGIATLVAGTVTVSTTKVTANSRIYLTPQTLGTILRPVGVGVTARTAGTSFTITSMDITDTSTVAWFIVEPA